MSDHHGELHQSPVKIAICRSVAFSTFNIHHPSTWYCPLFSRNSQCIPSIVNNGIFGRVIDYIDDGCIDENFFPFPLRIISILTKFSLCRPLVLKSTSLLPASTSPSGTTIPLPAVFKAPIRPDVVNRVHTAVAKNKRQPYAVSAKAGHQVCHLFSEYN